MTFPVPTGQPAASRHSLSAKEVPGFNLTPQQRAAIRRGYMNRPVPSDLSRETDPASTERGTA